MLASQLAKALPTQPLPPRFVWACFGETLVRPIGVEAGDGRLLSKPPQKPSARRGGETVGDTAGDTYGETDGERDVLTVTF